MRVLMVTHPLPGDVNGLDRNAPIARQIKSLQDIGVEIDVLTLEGRGKSKYAKALPKLRYMSKQVDLVHGHYGYLGWLARAQLSAPVLVSFMGSDVLGILDQNGEMKFSSRLEIWSNKILATLVDGIIVKSQEMADAISKPQVHVLPNGVDTELFRPADKSESRRELGWSIDDYYVLFPAYASQVHKNYHLAQEAVQRAESIVGKNINLIPFNNFSHDQIPTYMNASDVFVFTSFAEGSPNVIKEAMACNLPGVSVPVGDIVENLQGVSGYIICKPNAETIAESLSTLLLECPDVQGRAAIEELGLDLNSVAHRLLKIYQETVQNK